MDLTPLLAGMGSLVLQRLPDGTFLRQGAVPQWCGGLATDAIQARRPFAVEEVFPFLSVFLEPAMLVWGGLRRHRLSELWTEVGSDGVELHLQATAVQIGDASLLVVADNHQLFEQAQLVLQRARELRLAHDELRVKLENEEILVHTIVHDLASPLHSILGALSLLEEQVTDDARLKWIRLGLKAAQRQRQLIREILDVFSVENEVATQPPAGQEVPDLGAAVREVVQELTPVARQRGVRLETHLDVRERGVVGEERRLVRVLINLMDNAIRHSPPDGTVSVSARRLNGMVQLIVEDDGPGVPIELLPRLFEKLTRGPGGGNAGLGLYYCRITVEGWGGGIGYEPRNGSGARFWIRLPARPLASRGNNGGESGEAADSR